MDSGAPGLWARRVALGAMESAEVDLPRREAMVVRTQASKPEGMIAAPPRRGLEPRPGIERRMSVAEGAPERLPGDEAPRAAVVVGAEARSALLRPAPAHEVATRIGMGVGSEEGWPAAVGGRMAMSTSAIERTRAAMDVRGLIETAEERRARVEAYR